MSKTLNNYQHPGYKTISLYFSRKSKEALITFFLEYQYDLSLKSAPGQLQLFQEKEREKATFSQHSFHT